MKTLKPHPYVIKLLGCVTESGRRLSLDTNYYVAIKGSVESFQLYLFQSELSLFAREWLNEYVVFYSEPLLVLIEYVPYGDLLGYLRKSRGLNDTYFKDPDIKLQTSLTSQNLMKFSWQVADGMSYLSSRSVSWNILLLCIQISLVQTAYIVQTKIMQLRTHSIPLTLISATFCFNLRFDIPTTQW